MHTVKVHNISISPKANPLTIREKTRMEVRCVVNSNAVPDPTFTWYLGSTIISTAANTHNTTITITGNRTDNNKMLACEATNYNDLSKSANTTLSIECMCNQSPFAIYHKKNLKQAKQKEYSYLLR